MGFETAIPLQDITLRLLAATLCGAVLGLDREMRGKEAGLRTNTLVALSSALTTLVALELYWGLTEAQRAGDMDPTRVIQGVAQAIGFISAGVMIRSGGSVHGATTAAVIWMAGALGIACGAGFYSLAGVAVLLSLVVTVFFTFVMRRLPVSPRSESEE
jgi:putative Mg2+ transporter-C (MgtC) family protein